MRPTLKVNTMNLKAPKAVLLVTSVLVCLALAAPVMADDFVITGSDNSTNGTGTTNGGTAAAIADTAINGSDTVSLGIALTTTGTNVGIKTTNNDTEAESNTVTVTGTGSITTSTGNNAYGIYNDGAYNTTTVSGSITTTGEDSYGIYNKGDTNTTTVSETGKIETTGRFGHGIDNEGASNEINVSGSIKTAGDQARGIYNDGDENTTTLSGSILTTGDTAYGIYNLGNKNTTTMSGSITTTADSARGIYNRGDENINTISGSITTGRNSAHGIDNEGASNEINVSGSIKTAGEGAHGIANYRGSSNKITVSGTVKATGARSVALYNSNGSGNSLTLNEGATIIGDITANGAPGLFPSSSDFNATDSKLIFNLGASTSYAYSVSGKGEGTGGGQWTFSDLDGRSQVVTTTGTGCDMTIGGGGAIDTCNLVTAVGAANAEVQNELSYLNNSAVMSSLRGAKATHKDAEGNGAWVDVYGGSSKRTASTTDLTVLSFKSNTSGLTIGSPFMIGSTTQADFVFNTSRTNLNLSSAKDQTVKLTANKVGLVLDDLAPTSGWNVGAFGLVSMNSYKGTRKVMTNTSSTGSESVTSDYRGTEVIVGASVDKVQPISDTIRFEGGIDFNYTNENIAGYSESKYFTWGSRRTTHAAAGITAGLVYEKDGLTTFARVGTQRSNLMDGKTATYTNNGTAGSYTDSAKSDTYNTLSIGVSYKGSNGMSITGDISNSTSNNKVSGAITRLGFNWKF